MDSENDGENNHMSMVKPLLSCFSKLIPQSLHRFSTLLIVASVNTSLTLTLVTVKVWNGDLGMDNCSDGEILCLW